MHCALGGSREGNRTIPRCFRWRLFGSLWGYAQFLLHCCDIACFCLLNSVKSLSLTKFHWQGRHSSLYRAAWTTHAVQMLKHLKEMRWVRAFSSSWLIHFCCQFAVSVADSELLKLPLQDKDGRAVILALKPISKDEEVPIFFGSTYFTYVIKIKGYGDMLCCHLTMAIPDYHLLHRRRSFIRGEAGAACRLRIHMCMLQMPRRATDLKEDKDLDKKWDSAKKIDIVGKTSFDVATR